MINICWDFRLNIPAPLEPGFFLFVNQDLLSLRTEQAMNHIDHTLAELAQMQIRFNFSLVGVKLLGFTLVLIQYLKITFQLEELTWLGAN